MATEAALEAVCSLAAESRLVDLLAPGWAGGGSILRSWDKSGHCPRAVPRQVWTQRGGSCVSPSPSPRRWGGLCFFKGLM